MIFRIGKANGGEIDDYVISITETSWIQWRQACDFLCHKRVLNSNI